MVMFLKLAKCPSDDDLSKFINRKEVFGVVCQDFCEAYCRFRYLDAGWPGATYDLTAYKQNDMYLIFKDTFLP